jgi:hypothetical protein
MSEIFIAVEIQITVSSVGTAYLLKLPMRSIRKAILEDICGQSHCGGRFRAEWHNPQPGSE